MMLSDPDIVERRLRQLERLLGADGFAYDGERLYAYARQGEEVHSYWPNAPQ